MVYVVFGEDYCPYSREAASLVNQNRVIPMSEMPPEIRDCFPDTHTTVPVVFDIKFIGGCDELQNILPKGGSKKEYQNWEKRVIDLARRGCGKKMTKNKVIVVADIPDQIEKTKLDLHHIGNKRKEAVSLGPDASKGVYFYPATDTGGLTNYRRELLKKPSFVKGVFFTKEEANQAYEEWKSLSKREKFHGGVKDGFKKWMRSLPPGTIVKFVKLPKETRILISRKEVEQELGEYRIKDYNGIDHSIIIDSNNPDKLYVAVTLGRSPYITPNINENNLKNEYQ
ncbi:putative glutaredoxin [Tetraselmis virus 1]|uniref:Putative glutaredoxin n=1 Tax=Tetraselmis virus 1 TaxID=2060617 RepID=A0A2P0VMJ1_9VIRU|nr:putative glutaredoxin [Tetraselmis virus 1]AUF82111.1 putative glutaredoxin [Tetraselmis virus 1]